MDKKYLFNMSLFHLLENVIDLSSKGYLLSDETEGFPLYVNGGFQCTMINGKIKPSKETESDKETETESDKETETESDKETETESDKETETESDKETEVEVKSEAEVKKPTKPRKAATKVVKKATKTTRAKKSK